MERIEWAAFLEQLVWEQGEHVTLIGPTGLGKTTLALALMERRKYCAIIGTKPRHKDDTLKKVIWRRDWRKPLQAPPPGAWQLIQRWPPGRDQNRVVLWPKYQHIAQKAMLADRIRTALDAIYSDGSWCVLLDDTNQLIDRLGLKEHTVELLRMGRALDVSVISSLQRPRFAPLECYDQASHLFFWRDSDHENLKRVADIAGDVDKQTIRATVAGLRKHDVLYVNTRTAQTAVTRWEP